MTTTPKLLAIETAGQAGSVAFFTASEPTDLLWLSADRRHTVELVPAIETILARNQTTLAEIDLLAWSAGPGSFTGLRIGATVARMVASLTTCRVVSVPTLDVLAANADLPPQTGAQQTTAPRPPATADLDPLTFPRVVVLLDAQRGQAFARSYARDTGGQLRGLGQAAVVDPERFLAEIEQPFLLITPAPQRFADICHAAGGSLAPPPLAIASAAVVARLSWKLAQAGTFTPPAEILPAYLRPPACEEVYEQRRAAARARRGE